MAIPRLDQAEPGDPLDPAILTTAGAPSSPAGRQPRVAASAGPRGEAGDHRGFLGDNGRGRTTARASPGGGVRGFGEPEAGIMDRVWLAGGPVLVRQRLVRCLLRSVV